jgi:hypothetical protein
MFAEVPLYLVMFLNLAMVKHLLALQIPSSLKVLCAGMF